MLAENTMDWTLQWREEGRQEGEATLLLRMLTRRYGPLDTAVRRRIERASSRQLLEWGDRFVTAASVDEVFGDA